MSAIPPLSGHKQTSSELTKDDVIDPQQTLSRTKKIGAAQTNFDPFRKVLLSLECGPIDFEGGHEATAISQRFCWGGGVAAGSFRATDRGAISHCNLGNCGVTSLSR
ncbi:hypothetical protein [Bradyrhizobium sp. Tv2a-2]|uniref:hypothetical protein n=1 Tax=Bradyrhizobium sp. Tv2a-2 TaxID=113395 RepID=UPI001FD96185|nr:hypothetical protein [Bradyrhizobium sp. Tv2a-2]